jgi:hypothetical protein
MPVDILMPTMEKAIWRNGTSRKAREARGGRRRWRK